MLETVPVSRVIQPAALTVPSTCWNRTTMSLSQAHHAQTHLAKLAAAGENVIVGFVHVVLVEQRGIDGRQCLPQAARCIPSAHSYKHVPPSPNRQTPRRPTESSGHIPEDRCALLLLPAASCAVSPSSETHAPPWQIRDVRKLQSGHARPGCAASRGIPRISRKKPG